MNSIQLHLSVGVYDGISMLDGDNVSLEAQLAEFVDGIVVTDIERKNDMYQCTCISPMYAGPLFNIHIPTFQVDMKGIRIHDIEQISDYVRDYVNDNQIITIKDNPNDEISFS